MLSLQEIKDITFGAIEVSEENGVFYFTRFEGSAKKTYEHSGRSTASVLLDFVTDSDTLSFDYFAKKIIDRAHCFFDIYENDVLIGHVGKIFAEGEALLEGRYETALSEGKKRIRIYLPNLHEGSIAGLRLSEGASLEGCRKKKSILMLGDSITHGYDAYFPSLSYANIVMRELDLSGINQAIGGEMFREAILPDSSSLEPDYITVAYGTNDWSWSGRTLGDCVEKETLFFKKLRALYPKSKIFYISPLYRGDNKRITTLGDFSGAVKAFSEIAREFGFEVIDGVKLIPHDSAMFEDKYLHPNDLGFTQYASALIKELSGRGLSK